MFSFTYTDYLPKCLGMFHPATLGKHFCIVAHLKESSIAVVVMQSLCYRGAVRHLLLGVVHCGTASHRRAVVRDSIAQAVCVAAQHLTGELQCGTASYRKERMRIGTPSEVSFTGKISVFAT